MDGTKENPGIISRAMQDVFARLKRMWNPKKLPKFLPPADVEVKFGHVEIYNEKVYDLISAKDTDLPLRQDADGNIVIAGLSEVTLNDYADFEKYYGLSRRHRSTAATKMNAHSSRSHSVLRIQVMICFCLLHGLRGKSTGSKRPAFCVCRLQLLIQRRKQSPENYISSISLAVRIIEKPETIRTEWSNQATSTNLER
jgi:hypothetical protein